VQNTVGKEVLVDQLVANWQRDDLIPTEMAAALARLRDEHDLSQGEIATLTGKGKGEISKLLALHDKVVPAVKELGKAIGDQPPALTKRHLYNLSKLPAEQQQTVADRIAREGLNAVEAERLIAGGAMQQTAVHRSGLQARTRRFQTGLAAVVITFRKHSPSDADVRKVIEDMRQQMGAGSIE
jgi:ParB-like chromosome segregation protein Spo0J